MLGHAAAATDLRDKRIATIERDIETFDRTVAAVTAELAPDLKDRNADASVVELDRRRDAALTAHQEHQELTSKVTRLRGQIEKLEEDRKAAWISVQQLMQVANVEDAEDLRKAIVLSDQFRALDKKLAGVMKILEQQGDGLAIEVLEEECRDVDIDAVKVAKETAAAELEMLGKTAGGVRRSPVQGEDGVRSNLGRRRSGQGGSRL